MLSRQHNFYQQFLQLADALVIGASLWTAHALRFYILTRLTWFDDYPLAPQFANCYWMMALALPLGPLALEYTGLYRKPTLENIVRDFGRIMSAMGLVLLAIFTCVVVFRIQQQDISRAALGMFFVFSTFLLFAR